MYYSLQYLSLSDATVLTFLAPMCTAVTGAVLLHEKLSWREAFAGREYMRLARLPRHVAHSDCAVASLLGVVLIARPDFIFGKQHHGIPSANDVTPAQRVGAVG